MKNLTLKTIFNDLGIKYNLPEHVIEEVFNSQMRVVKDIIGDKTCSANIKLPYFGTFTNIKPKDNTTITRLEHDRLINSIDPTTNYNSITLLGELQSNNIKYKRAIKFKKDTNGNWTIDNKFKIID